jgi:acetyl esterase/lipase
MPQRRGCGRVPGIGMLWVGWLAGLTGCSGSAPVPALSQAGTSAPVSAASDLRRLESLGVRVESILATPASPAYSQVFAGGSRIRDDDMAALGAVNRLEVLNLDSVPVTDAGVAHLSGLRNLRWLYLTRTRVTGAGLRRLEPFPRLTILDVAGTVVDDFGLEWIARNKSLVGLDLTGTRVTDAGLKALVPLVGLEIVRLGKTEVTDEGLKALAAFRSLKSLSLDGCAGVRGPGLRSLTALPDLQVLVLNNSPIDDDAMAAIATLTHLSELHLEGTSVSDTGLARLRGLTSLRKVFLHGTRCTEDGAKGLAAALPQSEVTRAKPVPPNPPAQVDPVRFQHTADVIYGRRHGTALTLDIYTPEKGLNGAAVLWIVSDGFYSRSEMIAPDRPWVDELLRRGYRVFIAAHGSTPRYNMEDAVEDVHRAARFIRGNAAKYGIDPVRIGAGGQSAAGHLALMLGTSGEQGPRFEDPITRGRPDALDAIDKLSSRVGAVVAFYGPTDWRNFAGPGKSVRDYPLLRHFQAFLISREFDEATGTYVEVRDEARADKWLDRMSPIAHVTAKSAPTLLFHGDRDQNVPVGQSFALEAKLKAAGVPNELVVKAGAAHGWAHDPADMARMADWFDLHLKSGR